MLELNRIYNEDCLGERGMCLIPDKSVDLVVIDPPYNIGKDKRWDKWNTVEAYVEWMGCVFTECERVLKDGGSFYWFHNDFLQIIELQKWIENNSDFVFKQFITWNKVDNGFRNLGFAQQRLSIEMMRNYYNGFTEYCLYYTLQDDCIETPFAKIMKEYMDKLGLTQSDISKLEVSRNGRMTGWVHNKLSGKQIPTKEQWHKITNLFGIDDNYDEMIKEYVNMRYTFHTQMVKGDLRSNCNVWLYPPAKNIGHITPKPVEMIENIIRHSSNEYDTVLDCFMGSGTTAKACLNTNRNFIGFERDPDYYRIANGRIANVQSALFV